MYFETQGLEKIDHVRVLAHDKVLRENPYVAKFTSGIFRFQELKASLCVSGLISFKVSHTWSFVGENLP